MPIRTGKGDTCGCPVVARPESTYDAQYVGMAVICDDTRAVVMDSEWIDGRTVYLLETFDGAATQWVTRDRFQFLGERRVKSSSPRTRSDKEIVDQTVELTRKFANMAGFRLGPEKPYDSPNPRTRKWWMQACAAQEFLTNTDPNDAVSNLED